MKRVNAGILIKDSAIDKKGVFADRPFAKGEAVLRWHPQPLTDQKLEIISENDKPYIIKIADKWYVMQPPERYVNHSCDANTKVAGTSDIAVRSISVGEEITSDYSNIKSNDKFICNCGSPNCKGEITT